MLRKNKKIIRNPINKKIERFEKVMGWLPPIVISIITTLTYLFRIFWVKGISDYYKIDSMYLYGNYHNIITDVIVTFAFVIVSYVVMYNLYAWFLSKKGTIPKLKKIIIAIVGLSILNWFCIVNNNEWNYWPKIIISVIASVVEYLIYMPVVIISYNDINKKSRKKISTSAYIILFVIWILLIGYSGYSFSYSQVSRIRKYELIENQNGIQVIVAKYEDMFYTNKCEISNGDLIIYTDEIKMIDMKQSEVKRKEFEKIIIK